MKYIYILFAVVVFSACSKDDIGPMGLRNGQEVEVIIDHRYGAIDDRPLLLPNKMPAGYDIHGFNEREPGYIYKVRAKVHLDRNDPPVQDAASHWLNFMEIISKEKYEGDESFEIALIQSYVPGGPTIMLRKVEDLYYFISEKLTLTSANEEIERQLEEIWQHQEEIRHAYMEKDIPLNLKWRSITATVTHDSENFGKAYLVSEIEFVE